MIEADQSNKIEKMEKDTILAFSNKFQHSIIIPAQVKRRILAKIRTKGKSRKSACLWIFSAGLFLLFRPYLVNVIKRNELIVIDTEYTGHEANIKSMILRHCRKAGFNLQPELIRFSQIGKSSGAHMLAYNVQKGIIKADRRVKFGEFMDLL